MADPHPADDDKPQGHPQPPPPAPHVHQWVPIQNEWKEVTGYGCICGAYRPG